MVRPKKTEQTDLRVEIKSAAWRQIAREGAAALALRAIARDLHITAPAIYNYYPSRDDLVTALIVDAYNSMGDAQFAAAQSAPEDDPAARLRSLGLAYWEWAVSYPQRYQLIFGTPIPGYSAPEEITMPAAARSLVPLIACLEAAFLAGKLHIHREPALPDVLVRQIEAWSRIQPVKDSYILYAALAVWSRVHGLVSLELGKQLPSFIEDASLLYRFELERMLDNYLSL